MTRILAIFDDTPTKSEVIADVIGRKGFADVVVRKRQLSSYYEEVVRALYPEMQWRIIRSQFEFQELHKEMQEGTLEADFVLHVFSNYIVSDREAVQLTLRKLTCIEESWRLVTNSQQIAGLFFPAESEYLSFLRRVIKQENSLAATRDMGPEMPVEGLVDIGQVGNFIQCITGNFDSRYFNSLSGNDYTIVKSSTNKKKIKAEYTFYHLLPDDMKYWYVMPFNYREEGERSSYSMQRLHMTDLAIKWVHGSFDEQEFSQLMDMYFHFFANRHRKDVSRETYQRIADELYVNKVHSRIRQLKELPAYEPVAGMLAAGCEEHDVDTIADHYFRLKEKVEGHLHYPSESVIGHGDPCFANALYNKSTRTLKFIDPKGALTEEELWTNPYYDIAKLSHSICGRYDFFNNGLYDIEIDGDFRCQLHIDFDAAPYKRRFREVLAENGYDYLTVRIYEASLFLSMLPLHIDNPHKVLGFILNAREILREIEREV